MKKGAEILPEENYRLRNEDLDLGGSGQKTQQFGSKGGSNSSNSTKPSVTS